MSSDEKSQSSIGGTAATIGSVTAREGGLSAAQKRAALDNASVKTRAMDDRGEALDAALTDSAFRAKGDGELKAMGAAVLEEMRNNPHVQTKSGTDWAQKNIAQAGLIKELQKMIEGTPVVDERQCQTNVQHLLASKSLMEMSPLQVSFLQQNLQRLGLFKGKIDGDFTNRALVAGLDDLAHSEKSIEKSMKGSRASLDFVWAMRNTTPKLSEPSGEASTMKLFKQASTEVTAAPAPQPAREMRALPTLTPS